jgi:hypothetical protein
MNDNYFSSLIDCAFTPFVVPLHDLFHVKPPQPLKKKSYQMNVHIGQKNEILINYEGIVIKPTSKP